MENLEQIKKLKKGKLIEKILVYSSGASTIVMGGLTQIMFTYSLGLGYTGLVSTGILGLATYRYYHSYKIYKNKISDLEKKLK